MEKKGMRRLKSVLLFWCVNVAGARWAGLETIMNRG